MKHTAFLLLGSNIEPRTGYMDKALLLLENKLSILKRSSTYETAAWGMAPGTSAFLNRVVEIESELNAEELLDYCIACEKELGRIRTGEVSSRTIDIDILLFGNQIIQTEKLEIPHPRLQLRRFTLVPLAEIAPDLIHPVLKKSIKGLLEGCKDESEIRFYS